MNIKRKLSILLSCVILIATCVTSVTQAQALRSVYGSTGAVCLLKIPLDATVTVEGLILDDSKLVSVGNTQGRIHELATYHTGLTHGYKQYMVTNLANPADVSVHDSNGAIVYPTYAAEGIIDYTGADATFALQVNDTISKAAVAFHNRVGYSVNTNFNTYIKNGSDAYNKAIGSDAGRKYGKFVSPQGIAKLEVLDICKYSSTVFTTKVNIVTNETNGYVEDYNVYFLFENSGSGFQITDFTYMP